MTISYTIKIGRKQLGHYIAATKEWQDDMDNNTDFDSLDDCLEGLYEMYEYEKDYEFWQFLNKVKITTSVV